MVGSPSFSADSLAPKIPIQQRSIDAAPTVTSAGRTPGQAAVEKPLVYFDLGTGTIESRKKTKEAATMLGPAGVSNFRDPKRPDQTEAMPMNMAITAICSGDVEKRRAAAAE